MTLPHGYGKPTARLLVSALTLLGTADVARAQVVTGYNIGGYLGPTSDPVPATAGAGFSMYTAAWPLNDTHPSGYQSGLIGTWFQEVTWKQGFPYSDIEGGLGWWDGASFPSASPKFGIGGMAPNWTGFTNETGIRKGVYGFVHLSPWLLNPLDQGINLADGTFGDLFGYGYIALPLTQAKPTTDGMSVPTGDHAWTLFVSTANFKGPVGFIPPYFFSHWTAADPANAQFAGQLLDSQWGGAGNLQMETATIDAVGAADGSQVDVRTQPTYFPSNGPNGSSILLHRVTAYDATLFTAVGQWFRGADPAPSLPFSRGAYVRQLTGDGGKGQGWTWGLWGPVGNPSTYSSLGLLAISPNGSSTTACASYIPDPTTWGCTWNPSVTTPTQLTHGGTTGKVVKMPEYFRSISASNTDPSVVNWAPLPPGSVPPATGLSQVTFPGEGSHAPLIVDTSGPAWTQPGPAAGPFATLLQDGSMVTYEWFRFEDQPAMQNAGLTPTERDQLQAAVVKMNTAWTRDLDYLPPPTVGTLAKLDPGLLLTPPRGLDVGHVPIAVRQEWYGTLGNDLQQGTGEAAGKVIVTFTGGSGTWKVPDGVTDVEALLVGGGGGGGGGAPGVGGGGGGGGGAVVHVDHFAVSGSVIVSVGAGGSGGVSGGAAPGNGAVTLFASLVAFGGGNGASNGTSRVLPQPGASGGGGYSQWGGGGTTILGQGHAGGQEKFGNSGYAAAGGGGAGAVGGDAFDVAAGGAGGAGLQFGTWGTARWYGGGGGGGADTAHSGASGGPGGSGVGGTGGATAAAQAGEAHSGGGGGGGSDAQKNGAAGGSGVVIVSYTPPPPGGSAPDGGAGAPGAQGGDASGGSCACRAAGGPGDSATTRLAGLAALALGWSVRRRRRSTL